MCQTICLPKDWSWLADIMTMLTRWPETCRIRRHLNVSARAKLVWEIGAIFSAQMVSLQCLKWEFFQKRWQAKTELLDGLRIKHRGVKLPHLNLAVNWDQQGPIPCSDLNGKHQTHKGCLFYNKPICPLNSSMESSKVFMACLAISVLVLSSSSSQL